MDFIHCGSPYHLILYVTPPSANSNIFPLILQHISGSSFQDREHYQILQYMCTFLPELLSCTV